jgi:putative FmdB family regulatory protein
VPTYEYACRACGHVFEIVQKMSDDPLVICPECGGELRKVFAPPAISFKGSGFYATDQREKAKPSSDKETSSSSSSDTKSDAKKAAKKDDAASPPTTSKKDDTS